MDDDIRLPLVDRPEDTVERAEVVVLESRGEYLVPCLGQVLHDV
jgi:hypothetical protein